MKQRDDGFVMIPWILAVFISMSLFLVFLSYECLYISTKYVIQDALAAAALAGLEIDLEFLSFTDMCVVTDLDGIKEKTETALRESLSLDETMCPKNGGTLLVSDEPVKIKTWKLYNVFDGMVYETDLMSARGVLRFPTEGFTDQNMSLLGPLQNERGHFCCYIPVLDGEKALEGTSIYFRIAFAVSDMTGNTRILEKDILVDIKRKEIYGEKEAVSTVG